MRASDEQFWLRVPAAAVRILAVLLLGFSNRQSEVFYDTISEKAPQQMLPGPRICCGLVAAQAANFVVDLIAADQFLAGITLTLLWVSTWCVSAYYLLTGWH